MDDRVGLDSISFETFAWPAGPGDLVSRSWRGEDVVLSERFFPHPPDLPSLGLEELRRTYEAEGSRSGRRWLPRWALKPSDPARTTKLIDLAVARDTPIPVVRVIMRVPLPDRYAFVASLTLPLADCSWVVSVQAVEPDMTGLREAIALDSLLRGQGSAAEQHDKRSADESLEEAMASFDPYEPRWDGDVNDPLTTVRKHVALVEQSLTFRPEVLDQVPFDG